MIYSYDKDRDKERKSRAPDKVCKINFNQLYLCYFFTKSYYINETILKSGQILEMVKKMGIIELKYAPYLVPWKKLEIAGYKCLTAKYLLYEYIPSLCDTFSSIKF